MSFRYRIALIVAFLQIVTVAALILQSSESHIERARSGLSEADSVLMDVLY